MNACKILIIVHIFIATSSLEERYRIIEFIQMNLQLIKTIPELFVEMGFTSPVDITSVEF